jgi:multidrug resistance efflux pump
MENEDVTPFKELHSEEIQEIISRPPHWLLNWGISVTFGIIVLAVISSWWIQFPDVVTASFSLTSGYAPQKIIARATGRIHKLLVKDGTLVKTGKILLFSESTANHEQVLRLNSELKKLFLSISAGDWAKVHLFPIHSYTGLGELQNDFQTFYQHFEQLKTVLAGGYLINKRKLLLKDLGDMEAMEATLIELQDLQKRDYDLAIEEFKVQERLFKERVLSMLEYNREKAKLLSREVPLKNLTSSLIQNRTSQTAKKKELLELDNTIIQQKSLVLQALQTLRSDIEIWKQTYVLSAPLPGTISFAEPLQEQQSITTGQELMTVQPDEQSFRGLVKLAQHNMGKVSKGQKVLVKLKSYPYQEYGILNGVLTQLSATPNRDSLYWGYVDLPKGLTTRYGKLLIYKNGMEGTAEIITKDRSLAERLVSMIRDGGRQKE